MAKVSLRAYNREIETMMDRGQLDEAVAHCHHILKTFPKHLETYRLLGKAYLELKRHGDAVDVFSRALVAEPNDFVSHVGMSIIRDEQDKLDDAIWHMERAFETQPSNPAIQGELQRLYGRREGVQPARIRMTRGALAHMYVRGELYPQAISEIRSVLKEDGGRSDMQALLAIVYYKSGQKNEASDVASALLRRYLYCLDANRVLAEILGADRPESAQVYRQRVIELDPYAAQVNGTLFQSNEVGDAAVTLEHFDWNGQPTKMQPDWASTQAITLEGGEPSNKQQPDWLKDSYADTAPPTPLGQTQGEPASAFDKSAPPLAEPAEEIPDFLRKAGWGQAMGALDESKPIFADQESGTSAQPIEQGDLPDWVKAMAPAEAAQPAQSTAEEELPDWISKIGTNDLPVPSSSTPAPGQSSEDQPDWMKQFDQPASAPSNSEDPVWLKGMGGKSDPTISIPATEQPDWLGGTPSESNEGVSPNSLPSSFDFLNQTMQEPQQEIPSTHAPAATDTGSLGTSEQERDDSFAWLENLAAKQGATEGLLTKPEDRMEDEPEWVKQAKDLNAGTSSPVQPPSSPQSVSNLEELGKSEQERDDSFAWLENLAAKQGASEGLLTKPEERLETEPDWVKQAKDLNADTPASQSPVAAQPEPVEIQPEPSANDTAAWLRGLDAEDSAPAPVSSNDSTATWLKSLDEPEAASMPAESEQSDLPAWMQNVEEEKAPESVPVIGENEPEASAWMSSIEKPVALEAPISEMDNDLPSWLTGLDRRETPAPAQAEQSDDLPEWMRDEEKSTPEPTRATDWQPVDIKEPEPVSFDAPEDKPFDAPQDKPIDAVQDKPFDLVQDKPKPAPKAKKPAAQKQELKPAQPPEPYEEPVTRKGMGMLTQSVDVVLGQARNELSRSNIPGALDTYGKLIKKGRFLDEVIFDLRDALYRYPVEVSIWQSLGDAYMRANRLQDALDSYTKAEELLR